MSKVFDAFKEKVQRYNMIASINNLDVVAQYFGGEKLYGIIKNKDGITYTIFIATISFGCTIPFDIKDSEVITEEMRQYLITINKKVNPSYMSYGYLTHDNKLRIDYTFPGDISKYEWYDEDEIIDDDLY